MSGICGIVHADGSPVDPELLRRLTDSLKFRGPDTQKIWHNGPVGFGHTLLRTTFESEHERQPASLDGEIWITADARIDGWAELKEKLAAAGERVSAHTTDDALILHAYRAWGEDCVNHLIGDFAFAIWDGPKQKLFCARDHFGVRPFFYARVGDGLVFSNTLNCVRLHPAVSDTLNDLSIADHLLFEFIQDPTATAFADIQRLAPAQCLRWSATEGIQLRTYWTFPTESEVRYRPAGDYVERFVELFNAAVSDRLRSDRVSTEMSGGMDSTSIAAVALEQFKSGGRPFEFEAYTMVFDHLFPDPERESATLAAEHLGIPIHFSVADDFRLFDSEEKIEWRRPEPVHNPVTEMETCTMADAQTRHRVMLTGWDGDSLLNESPRPYFHWLWRQHRYPRLLASVLSFVVWQRRWLPWSWLDRIHPRRTPLKSYEPAYPPWLDPELERRFELRSRLRNFSQWPQNPHLTRPAAYRGFTTKQSSFFDFCDAGVHHLPMEFRHPMMDLRLLEFCLSLPPTPWCYRKEILREAMRGRLPESIRTRNKTTLRGSPHVLLLARPEAHWIDRFVAFPTLSRYVVRENIPPVCGVDDPDAAWRNTRPLSLSMWLQSLHSDPGNTEGGSPMNSNDNNDHLGRTDSEVRKPYKTPTLQIYGDIRALTNSSNAGGTADGMTGFQMQMSIP